MEAASWGLVTEFGGGVVKVQNNSEVQIIGTVDIGVNLIYVGGYVVLVKWVGRENDKRTWEPPSMNKRTSPVYLGVQAAAVVDTAV